ncbi:MAG: sensor histidine kinase [Chitinophagaceae bacterium]|nr:sensor histidine kinase [Chitinophagaceae bacterium]
MPKNQRFVAHLIFWAIHIAFTLYAWDLSYYEKGFLGWFIAIYFMGVASNLLFFYNNYFVLAPRFLLQKKYTLYVLFSLLNIGLFICSKAMIWNGFKFIDGYFLERQRAGIAYNTLFYFLISTAFSIYENWQKSEQKKIALKQELKETELLYLKSQMSPHFLFNTLNNIYSLSLSNNPQTSLSISQLKDLMIYVEEFESGKKITLANEIHYLKSFIALNQLRHHTPIDFQLSSSVNTQSIYLEPMLFLPFLENAFKHGLVNETNKIFISLSINSSSILFYVKNTIGIQKRKDTVGGIGIKNVRRRLELLHKGKYSLHTYVSDHHFVSDLTLLLS